MFSSQQTKKVFLTCFFSLSLLFAWTLSTTAFADKEQTLEEMVTQENKGGKKDSEKTGVELAYDFYEKCTTSPDYFVSEKIQKEYCRCKAAKMANSMSKSELLALEKDSPAGNDARDIMRMNADSLCMPPAIKSYTRAICMKDKQFKEVVLGKSQICDCAGDYMRSYASKNIPGIIIKASTQYPLSLDPLSFFLSSEDFNMMYGVHKEYCYNKVVYSQN